MDTSEVVFKTLFGMDGLEKHASGKVDEKLGCDMEEDT